MQKIILLLLFIIPGTLFAEEVPPKPTLDPIKEERKDLFNLTEYLPTYFLYHSDISKLQASFKYKVLRNSPLYIGYTHLIFWQLNADSRPIYDTNYNPEIFYRYEFKKYTLTSIDFIGIGHKSNGKDQSLSRSYDYSAVQFNSQYKLKSYLLRTGIRLKHQYNYDETNGDLENHQGPFEINFTVSEFMKGTIDKVELNVRLFTGGKWGDHVGGGGQEISLAFRVLGVDITPSFMIQYYHGYNESLQDYNKAEDIFRVGFLL